MGLAAGDLEHDISGARVVVLYLCRNGLRWYRRGPPADWNDTYEAIGDRFRIYQMEDEVDSVLLGKDVHGTLAGKIEDRYILLAPPKGRSTVCLLGVRWRLSAEAIKMTLNLHLFGKSQLKGQGTWHRGYRLELPHRTGVHTYTHVQPVVSKGWPRRVAVPFTEQGVPSDFPAFPLRGRNLTTLCAALAIALGPSDLKHIVHELRGNRMQTHVQSLLA